MPNKPRKKDIGNEGSKRTSTSEQIRALEEELSKTKYNKRTQHHIGLVKAKIARLREKEEARSSSGKKGEGYSVRKSGDATVVLLGFPSVGKSTLLNKLTNADSAVGSYAFTTLTVIPGTMEYRHAKIQILDVPGIVKGAASGTGRGKEVLQVIRSADLILILVDVFHPEQLRVITKEIHDAGIRMNMKRPDVRITKTSRGGIQIGKTVRLEFLDEQTIASILKEFRIANAQVLIREQIDADQLIDILQKNCIYVNAITALNKIDLIGKGELERIVHEVSPDICISADKGINLDKLKEMVFSRLGLIRVYCKQIGKPADMEVPMIVRKGCSVEDFASKLHRDFIKRFRFARVWGSSAKFPGQKLSLRHILSDGDVVELHLR